MEVTCEKGMRRLVAMIMEIFHLGCCKISEEDYLNAGVS
jgi:hypothetical protein